VSRLGFRRDFGLADDPLDVGAGDESVQVVLVVDDQHFVDANVFA